MSTQVLFLAVTLLVVCVYLQNAESCMCEMQHPQHSFCHSDFVIKAKVKNMKQIFSKRLTDDEEVTIREPYENRYSVRVKDIYKGSQLLKNVSTNHVYTAAYDSLCGVKLSLGEEYVLTDAVRSGYVLGNICGHGSVTDERDAARTSRMGIWTIRTLTDEIRKNYGYRIPTDFPEKSSYIRNNKMHVTTCGFVKLWRSLPKWQRRGVTDRYGDNCDCQIKVCYGDNCYHKNRVEGREDICILEVHKDRNMCAINSSFCKRKEGDECGWAHTSQWRACRRGGVKKVFVEP